MNLFAVTLIGLLLAGCASSGPNANAIRAAQHSNFGEISNSTGPNDQLNNRSLRVAG
jgi:hypothetical protein